MIEVKRLGYFGTSSSSSGHSFIPLIGKWSNEEQYEVSRTADGNDGRLYDFKKNDSTNQFGSFISEEGYLIFGCLYSPDDDRPGGKTLFICDTNSDYNTLTYEDCFNLIKENDFLKERFSKVINKYDLKLFSKPAIDYIL